MMPSTPDIHRHESDGQIVSGRAQTVPTPVRVALWGGLVLALAGVFFAWALTWKTGPSAVDAEPLPVGPEIPDFKLTERSGRTVTRADLLGRVWIADFIFTRCSGPCPQLSARMQRMQMNFKDEPEVKLVSFTLDPKNDTPAALQDYAKRFYAEPDRWWFLTTSDEGEMHTLVQKGFFQTLIPASGTNEMIHSEYFVLIDRGGRIRAAYPGLDADTRPRLVADVAKLLREPPG
jgi:cytochrome oxidase Cu insertion factor (SCO1/SenC/PrrC family)